MSHPEFVRSTPEKEAAMTLRKITVHLTGDSSDQMALQSAFQIAARFQCHLDALFVWSEDIEEFPLSDVSGSLSDAILSLDSDDGEPRYRLARRYFHAACSGASFREAETHSPLGPPTARLRKVTGSSSIVAAESRASDLVVFAHHGPDVEISASDARKAAISLGGRPILLCPPVLSEGMGETVMVAWNSTEHATRAIVGALPFLCAAGKVHVVTVCSHQSKLSFDEEKGRLMVEYLRLHGVHADGASITEVNSAAETILDEANRLQADLLVMGCSGKGRLSEFVLGSVSRDVITRSKLPLLVAH
jgi:nucleotide-binding universal stress UspA family protein